MSGLILDWPAAAVAGPSKAGGKGWQLALLAELGIPVPPGFVIRASAAPTCGRDEPLPASLLTELSNELARRGWKEKPLAVRSSAYAEDSTRASFAGIHHSSLNVRGADAVVAAVQAVRDSRWTPAAEAYRQRLGIDAADTGMAVIVMPLLPAVAAGIAFTCDPVSGCDDEFVIHANWGLGETLVGDQAQGDEYRLRERYSNGQLELIGKRRGSKRCMSVTVESGGTALRETPLEMVDRDVLDVEQVLELGELVRDVSSTLDYTAPYHDIEWVWDGERFWIVQARPVTKRRHLTYPALTQQPVLWSRGNSRDVVPDPLSAMDWSVLRTMLERMITRTHAVGGYRVLSGLRRIALRSGRLYFDTSILQWEVYDAFGVQPHAYNQLLGGHHADIDVPQPRWNNRLAWLARSLRFGSRSLWPRLRAGAIFSRVHRQMARLRARELPSDPLALAQHLREQLKLMRGADDLFLLQASGSALFLLSDLAERYCPGEGYALAAALMAGGDPSVTAEQGYALMDLARLAAAEPETLAWLRSPRREASAWARQLAADSPFRRAFDAFLERYGHRAVYESYLRHPRWREAPDYLLDSVLQLLDSDPQALRERQKGASAQARRRLRQALPWRVRACLPFLVRIATTERNLREGARSALTAYAEPVRRYVLALGQRRKGPNGLESVEDIFNLTLPEVFALAEGRLLAQVAARRAARRRDYLLACSMQVVPEVVIEQDGMAMPAKPAASATNVGANDSWRGITVGSGHAEGVAYVARHPTEAMDMHPRAILVAPSTDPSWTPAFLRASALVMETGGYLSHGAIVAREFGIPAVSNLPGIIDSIRSGDRLEVDGGNSTVRRLRTAAA